MVLSSMRCHILRMNIHSLDPDSKWSRLVERIEDACWNVKYTGRASNLHVIFGLHLTWKYYGDIQVFCPLSLVLKFSSHDTTHMIEHVIVHSEVMLLSDWMLSRHQQGPVSAGYWNLHGVLYICQFIQWCEEWHALTTCLIPESPAGEFLWSVCLLMKLQDRIPTCGHIQNR
jgi:hypothetical protein